MGEMGEVEVVEGSYSKVVANVNGIGEVFEVGEVGKLS